MTRLSRSKRFKRATKRLGHSEQVALAKALRLLSANPRHPGLRVKRVRSTKVVFEARVSRGVRLTFQAVGDDTLLLRNVGPHDSTLSKP